MALEQEYKFVLDELPDERVLLRALEGAGLRVENLGQRQQQDVYYDSPAGALRERGMALRRRSYDNQHLATLKEAGRVEGGLHAREELELHLTDGSWPEAIRARLEDVVAVGELRPIAELKSERRRYKLSAGGKALAELSLDAVEAAGGGEERAQFFEVELEAIDGDAHDLADLAGLLRETLPLTPSAVTKLERALLLLNAAEDARA